MWFNIKLVLLAFTISYSPIIIVIVVPLIIVRNQKAKLLTFSLSCSFEICGICEEVHSK
jgi:succinate dehydrogenase/fumarate reductase-like Fe-S protein